jgi:hypothetical protein
MKIPPYRPNIPTGSPGGGSAGIPLAEKDRRRGVVPGAGLGGSAGQIPAAAVRADRASVAPDHVDGMTILPRIKRV